MRKIVFLVISIVLVLATVLEANEERVAPGMKCGAGKCGANMFDGNAALGKKKKNILTQMRDDDPRKDCVIQAVSTKAAYDCVRDPVSKRMTKRCGATDNESASTMKCGAGRCGNATGTIKLNKQKSEERMKCGAGKCGGVQKESLPDKEPAMRCGAGRCGSSM